MNSTPDISDKFPDLKFLNIQFKSFGAINFFSGQLVTAICPEDNSKIKKIEKLLSLRLFLIFSFAKGKQNVSSFDSVSSLNMNYLHNSGLWRFDF